MKHCPRCMEEYVDTVSTCAECGSKLVPGPPAADDADESDDAPEPASDRRPADSETVLSAPPEYAHPVALALSRAGIPALVFDCLEKPEGVEGPMCDVVVPLKAYNQSVWFCKGFEAAAFPDDGDEKNASEKGEAQA